jgi:hypothetical protein
VQVQVQVQVQDMVQLQHRAKWPALRLRRREHLEQH